MWILLVSLLCALAIFPDYIESQLPKIIKAEAGYPLPIFGVVSYRNKAGHLIPVTQSPNVFCAITDHYVLGIYLSKFSSEIYAIYDEDEKQIILDRDPWPYKQVTKIPEAYRRKFVRLTPPTPPPSPSQEGASSSRLGSPSPDDQRPSQRPPYKWLYNGININHNRHD